MPKDTEAPQPDWSRLTGALDEHNRVRLDQLLRRALKRRQADLRDPANIEAPDSIRSLAVGEWRRRFIENGGTKAAARKRTYARLKRDKTYQAIERELVRRHLGSILRKYPLPEVDVKTASLPEVCAAYRATAPRRTGTALDGFASEVCAHALKAHVEPEVRRQLAELACTHAQAADLSTCAWVTLDGPPAVGGGRMVPFTLADACTPEDVAARVSAARLAEGILKAVLPGDTATDAVAHMLRTNLAEDPQVRATDELLAALFAEPHPLDAAIRRQARKGAQEALASLRGPAFTQRLAAAVLENERYRAQYDRSVELRLHVRRQVPATPMEAYPLARSIARRVVLHVGPTNSGKTHEALQALAAAGSGAYLGPLRLLAYEQFERLNQQGCPCSLLTGEEAVELAGAHHVASTVEMADFGTPVDVAVLDEAQMVADPDRGQHWTAALLGVPARELHVCCAPHAEQAVRQLVTLCGDSLEVVRHDRLVPLHPDRGGFALPKSVRPGDALIVFSRRAVHEVAEEVAAAGLRPSVIYGALPYDVRHEEARRFDAGETDVVVATDAIGMGMNLPIRRIVFVQQQKYDGHALRTLKPEEVQQIAGRAGRFGRYDEGLFQATAHRRELIELYGQPVDDIVQIPVGIPANIALVQGATLSESVRQWMAIEQPAPFVRIDVARDLGLIAEVEALVDESALTDRRTKELALALATMPFDEGERRLRHAWRAMVAAELAGRVAELPLPGEPDHTRRLAWLEEDYRYCDLLYNYARTFGHDGQVEALVERRAQISRTIMDLLAEGTFAR